MVSKIYLKSLDRRTLVHEAAHARHLALGPSLSEEYDSRFPIVRLADESWNTPAVQTRNGLVNSYAAFDYTLDGSGKEQKLPEPRDAIISQTRWGVQVDIHNTPEYMLGTTVDQRKHRQKQGDLLLQRIFKLVQTLPGKLADHARHIIVWPRLNCLGVCDYDSEPTNLHYRRTEDIAVHTEWFDLALTNPREGRDAVTLLQKDRRARERLEFLTRNGFLNHSYAHQYV